MGLFKGVYWIFVNVKGFDSGFSVVFVNLDFLDLANPITVFGLSALFQMVAQGPPFGCERLDFLEK